MGEVQSKSLAQRWAGREELINLLRDWVREGFVEDLWFAFSLWKMGAPWWLRGSRICLPCGSPRFYLWVRKIPCRKVWQPTPVFLPGEFHGQRNLEGCSPWGSQRVGHDWVTNTVWKMRPCRDRGIPGRGNRTFKSLQARRQMVNLRNRPFHVAEIHIAWEYMVKAVVGKKGISAT